MSTRTLVHDVFIRRILLICFTLIFSLGSIGGCNNNNGSGSDGESRTSIHGVVLGMHSDEALDNLRMELDIGEHTGEASHIHLDGKNIGNLTDEEKMLIREAYDQGFIISLYDMDEARIQRVYRDVLQDPFVHAEADFVEPAAEDEYFAFNIEQINGTLWSSISTNDAVDMLEEFQNLGEQVVTGDPDPLPNEYRIYGEHTRNWIEEQPLRRELLLDDGIVSGDLRALENELVARDVVKSGSLVDNAKSFIQTNKYTIDFLSSGAISGSGIGPSVICGQAGLAANNCRNTYTIVSQAWILTNDSSSSFLFVQQDMTLDNTDGWIVGESVVNDSRRQKAWYMSNFTVANYLAVNKVGLLFSSDASLVVSNPETNSSSIDISESGFGNSRFDTLNGGTDTSSSLIWTVTGSSDFSDLTIENVSETLAQVQGPQLGNDASWIYSTPVPGKTGTFACKDRFLDAPKADARGISNPIHAFVFEIGDFPNQTVVLKTSAQVVLNNTGLSDCGLAGCRCKTITTDTVTKPKGLPIVFNQSINIPDVP